jgi:hypothetical protein
VNDEIGMKIIETLEHLKYDTFDLRFGERGFDIVLKTGQIVLTIFHHQEYAEISEEIYQ